MAVLEKLRQNLGRIYGKRKDEFLNAVLGGCASQLEVAHSDTSRAVAQLKIQTSAAPWLEIWGGLFKVPRRSQEETDTDYGLRIIEETIRQRPQPGALTQIVGRTLGITIVIKNLWPFVLMSDQFSVPAGRPPQVSDGHLEQNWIPGSVDDIAVRSGFGSPYLEGAFGVWLDIELEDPFEYTLDNVKNLLPLVLLSDDFSMGSLHVSDGQLTTPDFGGPNDTARHSFAVMSEGLPASVNDVLALLNRHRAAGTEPIFMGFVNN